MANIGFFVLPNIGGVNACFKLASDLRERGHQISFFGIEDCKEAIQANGFEFVCVFQEFFKKGDYHEQAMVGSLPIGLELFRAIKHLNARFQVFFDGLLSSGVDDFIETLRNKRPDLIIFTSGDIYLEWPAMLAYMKGFNSIYFNDGSYTCEEEGMPPHSSTYIPTDAMKSRLIIFLLWKWGDFKQTLALLTCKLLGIDPGFHEFTTKLARQCGYDLNIHHIPSESAVPRVPEFMPSHRGEKSSQISGACSLPTRIPLSWCMRYTWTLPH